MAQFKKITSEKQLKLIANTLRQDVIKAITEAKSGHPGGSLGMADVFAVLYFNVLKHDPKNPSWQKRDKVILSNGHICPVLYSAMAESGYFPVEELQTLRKLSSRLQGHPHFWEPPGVENSSGPLAQGISIAIGMALAAKMDGKKNRIYCLASDGEHEEGQYMEALMFAGNYKLDNLCVVVDRNHIQIDGDTENIMPLEPLKEKYLAFKWHVIEVNGHGINKLLKAFQEAGEVKGKPTVMIANTTPGKGVSFMENNYEWHGKPTTPEQAQIALTELQEIRRQIEVERKTR